MMRKSRSRLLALAFALSAMTVGTTISGVGRIQAFADSDVAEESSSGASAGSANSGEQTTSPVVSPEVTWEEDSARTEMADGNVISEERLNDNTVEYDELGSLIHRGNTSAKQASDATDSTRQQYTQMKEELTELIAEDKRKKGDAKDSGDMDDYAEYSANLAIYRASISQYNKMLQRMNRKNSSSSQLSLERTLTNGAQSLMISYQSVKQQEKLASQMQALYQTQYENTCTMLGAGLASQTDVDTAYANLLSAQQSAESAKNSEDEIYENLCLMLGLATDGSIEIAKIPSADASRVDSLDLSADTQTAIGNNTELISIRSNSSNSDTAGMNAKSSKEQAQIEQVKTGMQDLYNQVLQSRQALVSAQTGAQSAEITWKNAQSKYSLGMLSKAEYLQTQISYTQKKNALESANLSLFQALNTYDWAVKGIMQ